MATLPGSPCSPTLTILPLPNRPSPAFVISSLITGRPAVDAPSGVRHLAEQQALAADGLAEFLRFHVGPISACASFQPHDCFVDVSEFDVDVGRRAEEVVKALPHALGRVLLLRLVGKRHHGDDGRQLDLLRRFRCGLLRDTGNLDPFENTTRRQNGHQGNDWQDSQARV